MAVGDLEDDVEPGLVERSAADVGVQLGADRAKLAHRPVQFPGGGLGVVHRQRGGEASEPVWMLRHQVGQFVVGGPG